MVYRVKSSTPTDYETWKASKQQRSEGTQYLHREGVVIGPLKPGEVQEWDSVDFVSFQASYRTNPFCVIWNRVFKRVKQQEKRDVLKVSKVAISKEGQGKSIAEPIASANDSARPAIGSPKPKRKRSAAQNLIKKNKAKKRCVSSQAARSTSAASSSAASSSVHLDGTCNSNIQASTLNLDLDIRLDSFDQPLFSPEPSSIGAPAEEDASESTLIPDIQPPPAMLDSQFAVSQSHDQPTGVLSLADLLLFTEKCPNSTSNLLDQYHQPSQEDHTHCEEDPFVYHSPSPHTAILERCHDRQGASGRFQTICEPISDLVNSLAIDMR